MNALSLDYRLYGKQVYLRPIIVEDTDMVLKWRNHKNVVENFIYRKPISREEHLSWLENKVNKGQVHQFVICFIDDDTPIGSAYLQNFDEVNKQGEYGIFLADIDIKGRGIGTEVARLIVKHAFEELKLHKLKSRVLGYNTASLRMLEKAGYTLEGCLKDELYLDGKYVDLVFAGIVNEQN